MRRQLIILTVLFILSINFALADFSESVTAVKKDIFLGEVAEFNITIRNFMSTADVFSFSNQDPSWVLLNQQVIVAGNSTETFKFRLDPGNDVSLGIHAISVKIKSLRSNEYKTEIFVVNIRPYDPIFGEYRPSVQFGVSIDKEIDPRKKIPVEVYMRNRNALDISEGIISIDGELFHDEVKVTLGPLEEKRTEYLFNIDSLEKPSLHSLDVSLIVKNTTISRATQNYEVKGYSVVTMDREEKSFLFKKEQIITLENIGNAKTTKQVNLVMPWTERIFTGSEPKSEVAKTPEGTSLEWQITLEPQDLKTVTVTTNYRIPILIIIVILAIIVLYFVFRSPIIMAKEALISDKGEDGVEMLKIRIFVKNRISKPVERVAVIDRIPGIAEVIHKQTLGTITPEKITKHENKGTIMRWNLENLEPYEERIITYEIKSKLKIIGNISLPSSRVRFFYRNREKTVFSNKILVMN